MKLQWARIGETVGEIEAVGNLTRFYVSDGSSFSVAYSLTQFNDLLSGEGYLVEIFDPVFSMSESIWRKIQIILNEEGSVFKALAGQSDLIYLLQQDHGYLKGLPYCLYGGSSARAVYLCHHCHFDRLPNETEYSCVLFSEPFIAVIKVNLKKRTVSVTTDQRTGERLTNLTF